MKRIREWFANRKRQDWRNSVDTWSFVLSPIPETRKCEIDPWLREWAKQMPGG